MKTKNKILFLITLAVPLLSLSCSDDPTAGGPLINYDFIIDNQTETDYQVYLQAVVEGESGFTRIGDVAAFSQFRKANLVIDISYECRLVISGGSVDDPAHSKSFMHTTLNDYIWTLK